jgi:hypothetical protein
MGWPNRPDTACIYHLITVFIYLQYSDVSVVRKSFCFKLCAVAQPPT